MKTIQQKIQNIKEELELFDEEMDKYQYIIDFGKSSSPIEEQYKNNDNLVKGCTSRVWMAHKLKHNKLILYVDSETVIVKGLANIVKNIFSEESIETLTNINLDLLKDLDLQQLITPSRQNGVASMLKKIQYISKRYTQKEKI